MLYIVLKSNIRKTYSYTLFYRRMRMWIIEKKDIYFVLGVLIMCLLSIFVSVKQSANVYSKDVEKVFSDTTLEVNTKKYKVIVDAGHGEPDGGAVTSDGVKE